jgi:hypothetical protein
MTGRVISILRLCPIVGAVLLLLVINVVLISVNPLKSVDPESLPAARSWVWWATQDFKQRTNPPNVVLLGSSAMMHPVWLQEAAYRNKDVDLAVDHSSHYLESVIEKDAPGTHPNCFNFALPGSMVSDDYMILRAMLTGERKPEIAVIGLTPREFVDNKFNCAASSKHYQYLSRFTKTDDLVALSMPQLWQRSTWLMNDLVYFKGKSQHAKIAASEWLKTQLHPFLLNVPDSPLNRTADLDRRFASWQQEIEKGVWIAHPTGPYHYMEVAFDCIRRHKSPNNPLYENQKRWLEMCLEICRKEGIKPVLVNMPVTPEGRRLISPAILDRHLITLKSEAERWHCDFLNADIANYYENEDFTDWAHMDASGGEKVLRLIGEYIASRKGLVASLSSGNRSIATQGRQGM